MDIDLLQIIEKRGPKNECMKASSSQCLAKIYINKNNNSVLFKMS
jgi:hypothetical protein